MTNSKPATDWTSIDLRLPAAILRFWSDGKDGGARVEDELAKLLPGDPGFYNISQGTLAITAESGDPAIFDSAIYLAEHLIDGAKRRQVDLRLLVLPGEIQRRGNRPTLTADALVESAPTWFNSLEPGQIHMTGWTAHMLEQTCRIDEIQTSSTMVADRSLPIYQAGSVLSNLTPWRNPQILNRKIRSISRRSLEIEGKKLISEPAWRIEGPVGCGKTYFAHHLLLSAGVPRIWLRGAPAHRRRSSLTRQLLDQLAATSGTSETPGLSPQLGDSELLAALRQELPSSSEEPSEAVSDHLPAILGRLSQSSNGPFYLVCDDLQQSTAEDLEILGSLLKLKDLGTTFRLLLIGRGGQDLPKELKELATVTVGPFDEAEMDLFSPQLFSGLSLPAPTRERLHSATQGCPFALEEGMFALIREKNLRRVYGSFFFAGQDSAGFSPSSRLLCHLQAEAFRMGIDSQLHLLSLIDGGAPQSIIGRSATQLSGEGRADWDIVGTHSGLLDQVDTPWGAGIDFSCSAFGTTLAHSVTAESLPKLRSVIGSLLASNSKSGEASWESYKLLKSTEAGIEPLIKTLESPYSGQIPGNELLDVLTQELYRHRERQGAPETELALLWKLLPLARRIGRLHEYTVDLGRAVQLAHDQPNRLLALAGLKAEMDQDAGRYGEAESTIRLALNAAKGIDDRRQALLLIQLGRLLLDQERWSEARNLFQKLATNLDSQGADALAASCRYYLGNIAFHEEHLEEALEVHSEALQQRRQQGLNRAAGNSLTAIGAVCLVLGNYPQALKSYREALQLLEEHGGEADRAFPLLGIGRTMNFLGDYTSASRPLRQALEIRQGKDEIAGEAVARLAVAENHLFLGQLEKAQEEATKAHFHFNLLSRKGFAADAEQLLGRIQMRLRQFDSAKRHLDTALESHREKHDLLATAFDQAYLIDLALIVEDNDEVALNTVGLLDAMGKLVRPELAELLHYHLYRGLEWLKDHGRPLGEPLPSLERAYSELFGKASHLQPELRHHFLFQIAEHREIIDEAARAGLSIDAGSSP
jgi:tetratricopeptide (TPR) repeat protein